MAAHPYGPGWEALRRATFAAKGRVCWWCGALATTVDHVVPVVLGGATALHNLVPSCAKCNYSRGASLGNRLRPPRPLTVAQRRAIGLKRAVSAAPGQVWRRSRNW
jgi:5-methylcytosine-specific restriction endonuclease McrA